MTLHEILDRLLPCKHKWKIIENINVYPMDKLGSQIGELPIGTDIILQCEVCGDVMKRKV